MDAERAIGAVPSPAGQRANTAPTPRRVLMTADTVGGVWQYALELCRELTRGDVEVMLATMGALPSRDQRAEADAIAGLTLHPTAYRLLWMDDPWADVQRAGDWLQALAADVRPHIVHLNDYAHATLPWPAPVLVVAHSCVLSWWQAVRGMPAPPAWARYGARVRRGLHAADLVVAPTQAMLDAVVRHYGHLPSTAVIANGRAMPASEVRREPLVLSAGRLWDDAKNVAALAAVAPRLPWPVCIAGEQRHPDGIPRAALPNVQLPGRLTSAQLAHWFARASIYALPARYEPFGLSALEAALSGCALVLGDIPSLREVWGDAALYVAPDDHDALADVLLRLIGDADLRARQAQRAVVRARRYSPSAMADGYRDAYAALLAQGERYRPVPTGRSPRLAMAGVSP